MKKSKQNSNDFNQTLMEKAPASQALLETAQKLEPLRTDWHQMKNLFHQLHEIHHAQKYF